MGRLIGTVLILSGCAGLLFCWIMEQEKKRRMMEAWIRLYAVWGYALEKQCVPLLDFLDGYESGLPELQAFFAELCEQMRERKGPDGGSLWRQTLSRHKRALLLHGEAGRILWESADAFYGTSARLVLRSAGVCQKRMEDCLLRARAEYGKKFRLYVPLGMTTGVVTVLLLL